jgi:hypothetical protein
MSGKLSPEREFRAQIAPDQIQRTDQPQIQDKKTSLFVHHGLFLLPSSFFLLRWHPRSVFLPANLQENFLKSGKSKHLKLQIRASSRSRRYFLKKKSPALLPTAFSILQICGIPGAKI